MLLWKSPEAIGLLLWRVPSTIEPRLIVLDASGQHKVLYNTLIKGRRWFFVLVATVSLFYMSTGQRLAELWVGEHAPEAGWMYIAGGFALFFSVFDRWPISFAYALIRLRNLVKVAVIEVVGKLILNFFPFPLCQYRGAYHGHSDCAYTLCGVGLPKIGVSIHNATTLGHFFCDTE